MTTTWSPTSKNAHAVLSNGSLTAATDGAATHCVGVATASIGAGVKRYWEVPNNISAATHEAGAGLANASQTFADNDFLGNSAFSIGAYNDGAVYKNYSGTVTQFATVGSFSAGQTQCFATIGGSKLWIRIDNGGWNNDILANQDPANNIGGLDISDLGIVIPGFDVQNTGKLTANFGATAFAFTPPTGFTGFDQVPVAPAAAPGGAGGEAHNPPKREVIVTIYVDDDEEMPTETPATETVAPVTPYPKRKKAKKAQKAQPVAQPQDDEEEEALMMLLAA